MKKKETRAIEEPVLAAPANLFCSRYRHCETAKYVRVEGKGGGENNEGGNTVTSLAVAPVFGLRPQRAADQPRDHTAGGCFLGERDPSHLGNNSIRLYRGLCKRMTRVSARGWPAPIRRPCDSSRAKAPGTVRFTTSRHQSRLLRLRAALPNQFYLARVIAGDLLDQPITNSAVHPRALSLGREYDYTPLRSTHTL